MLTGGVAPVAAPRCGDCAAEATAPPGCGIERWDWPTTKRYARAAAEGYRIPTFAEIMAGELPGSRPTYQPERQRAVESLSAPLDALLAPEVDPDA